MITTVGMVLINPKKQILVGHITNGKYDDWSIIKGIIENNEDNINALYREFFEETSLVLKPIIKELIDFSKLINKCYLYNHHKKKLYGYYGLLYDNIPLQYFKCQSYVNNNIKFPEIDAFTWLDFKDIHILHYTQQELITDLWKFV